MIGMIGLHIGGSLGGKMVNMKHSAVPLTSSPLHSVSLDSPRSGSRKDRVSLDESENLIGSDVEIFQDSVSRKIDIVS